MAKMTYMPLPHDPAVTVVDRITFKAYEAVAVADDWAHTEKLERNPWFTTGIVDEQRKALWDQAQALPNPVAGAATSAKDGIERIAEKAAAAADGVLNAAQEGFGVVKAFTGRIAKAHGEPDTKHGSEI
jgi:hypothetical protein